VANALVAVVPSGRGTLAASPRPNADFVAHLIATSAQAPQTRARRRAEPEVAVAAYGALDRKPAPVGRAVSRSL
jgi:hypothetical protein